MTYRAVYQHSYGGFGHFRIYVDGVEYGCGGLPMRVHGRRIMWTAVPNSPDFTGEETGQ